MSADLKGVVALAKLLQDAQKRVEDLTGQLAVAKEALLQIEREDLPEMMRGLELTQFKLEDGSVVEVKDEIDCSITEANRGRAHAWLTANGFGGLIKSVVSLSFSADEHEQAVKTAEEIGGELKEAVHPATLKSFVKEQREKGVAIPETLFGIFPYSKAKLTPPKPKKAAKK